MAKVAIVILNYNGVEMFKQFLPSVIKHTQNHEIIIADNASTDGSVAYLKANFPELKLILLPTNTGYAGGYNEALKQISAEYFVLLNSDVEVTPNWVDTVIKSMEQNNWVAAMPKIRSYTQPELFEYAGAAGGYIDKLGYPFCRGRIFDNQEVDNNQYNQNSEIFWATGACMFIKSSIFNQLNGFDSRFFAHMEEIDLCWRIHGLGLKIGYCANSTVYHLGGGTLQKDSPKKVYLNFRNGLYLLFKNLPQNQLFGTLFQRMVLDGVAAIQFIIKGKFSLFNAVLQAHIDFYKANNWLMKERENTQKVKDLNSMPGFYNKSIVWQYFVSKKKTFSELMLK